MIMGDIIPFHPRRPPPATPETRVRIEGALALALDAVDQLVAALDDMDVSGEDLELDTDLEPSLGAPENLGSQIVWLRGGDRDFEVITPTP